MEDSSGEDQNINPLNLDKWREEAISIGGQKGFGGSELDAFRHIYTNAMTVYTYGSAAGAGYTAILGTGYEIFGLGISLGTDLVQSTAELLGIEISEDVRLNFSEQVLSSIMDTHNNVVGFMIGSAVSSKEDLIEQAIQAISSGWAITNIDKVREILRVKQDNARLTPSFIASYGASVGGLPAGFDPSHLSRILGGGRRRGGSVNDILLTSAAGLASALLRARRGRLEEDLIDIFTGGNGGNNGRNGTPPFVPDFANSGGNGFSNILGGIFDNLIGASFSRQRNGTTSRESDRSQEYSRNWDLSQGQYAALLTQWMQQAQRNL